MKLEELVHFLEEYLDVGRFDDLSMNGLQVEGKENVERIAFAVSACGEVFRKGVSAGSDALVVHHGLFWKGKNPEVVAGIMKDRLKTLLDGECSLLAYHLPLDAHPEAGNNAAAARELGLQELKPFAEYRGVPIGVWGVLDGPIERNSFIERVEEYYSHAALVIPGGSEKIERVGIVSGGAPEEVKAAVELGLDAFITGESSEPITYYCREAGINFLAMGHYATERVGVRALSGILKERFGVETRFIEVENEA